MNKLIQIFIRKDQSPRIAKIILKNKVREGLALSDFKTSYKSRQHGIGKRMYTSKSGRKQRFQKIDSCRYSRLIFDKGTKPVQWRKNSLLNKCYWNNWTSFCKIYIYYLYLHMWKYVYIINSKYILGLNVKCKTIKLRRKHRRKSR